jgi:hypothetical protein
MVACRKEIKWVVDSIAMGVALFMLTLAVGTRAAMARDPSSNLYSPHLIVYAMQSGDIIRQLKEELKVELRKQLKEEAAKKGVDNIFNNEMINDIVDIITSMGSKTSVVFEILTGGTKRAGSSDEEDMLRKHAVVLRISDVALKSLLERWENNLIKYKQLEKEANIKKTNIYDPYIEKLAAHNAQDSRWRDEYRASLDDQAVRIRGEIASKFIRRFGRRHLHLTSHEVSWDYDTGVVALHFLHHYDPAKYQLNNTANARQMWDDIAIPFNNVSRALDNELKNVNDVHNDIKKRKDSIEGENRALKLIYDNILKTLRTQSPHGGGSGSRKADEWKAKFDTTTDKIMRRNN